MIGKIPEEFAKDYAIKAMEDSTNLESNWMEEMDFDRSLREEICKTIAKAFIDGYENGFTNCYKLV